MPARSEGRVAEPAMIGDAEKRDEARDQGAALDLLAQPRIGDRCRDKGDRRVDDHDIGDGRELERRDVRDHGNGRDGRREKPEAAHVAKGLGGSAPLVDDDHEEQGKRAEQRAPGLQCPQIEIEQAHEQSARAPDEARQRHKRNATGSFAALPQARSRDNRVRHPRPHGIPYHMNAQHSSSSSHHPHGAFPFGRAAVMRR